MVKKGFKGLGRNSFIGLLSMAVILLISVFILNTNNFNLGTSAFSRRSSLTGTLVMSSQSNNCNSAYTYSIITDSNRCASIIVSASRIEGLIGSTVNAIGVLKNNVFYVTSLTAHARPVPTTINSPRPLPSLSPRCRERPTCLNDIRPCIMVEPPERWCGPEPDPRY